MAFYQQEGFSCAYPKRLVYPVEGGEMQLEQLRARLPQYFSPPPPAVPNVSILYSHIHVRTCILSCYLPPSVCQLIKSAC